jgi:cyclopropane fatty-acyl-phospholipid synthase-like methyltransferase
MAATENINNFFFNGIYKDVWKKINSPGLTEAEVDLIQSIAHLEPSHKVLDLMCGYGRHSLALAKKGIQITAVDNQQAYIDEIKTEALSNNLPLTAIWEDVLAFSSSETFEAVICMGNSFAFFDMDSSIQLLKKVAGSLKEKGVFIINSWMIAEIAIRHFKEKDWFYVGEYKYLLDYRFQFNPNRIESEQTIITPEGLIETNLAVDYIFTLDELGKMCKAAGLRIRELYSTPRKKKFSMGDGQIYIVLEKFNS